jgi:hypothetical protein
MTFALILHFMLNGHVHTVDSGQVFTSQEECRSAGEQAKGFVNLTPGERYSFTCRPR